MIMQAIEDFVNSFNETYENVIETYQREHDRMDSLCYWGLFFLILISVFTLCSLELLLVAWAVQKVFGA